VLVYGDRWRSVAPAEQLAELDLLLRSGGAGRRRHDALVRALIEAGELAQGLADAEFAVAGCDDDTPLQAAALELVTALARKVQASWWSGFADEGPAVDGEFAAVAALAPPEPVRCKTPEGYAYYAVYPEAFIAAAAELAGDSAFVIGLRSIGVSLAGAVAASAEAAGVVTLRPHGHPFERQVSVSDRLRQRMAAHTGRFALVDEGPGLSGSSFGAVGDLLEDLGVSGERIVFLPSHPGDPGRMAQVRHRQRWGQTRRLVKTLDDLAGPEAIAAWFEDVIGAVERVEDLSHGGWRQELPADVWPPVWASVERRKLRLSTRSGIYLARFAGLGRDGADKFERVAALHAAGFVAEPLALRHGFLLERWLPGKPLLTGTEAPAEIGERLGDYLSFRRLHFPADAPGGSGEVLREMALVNAEALGGAELRERVDERLAALSEVEARLRPIHVDGRLHLWEWRLGPDGVLRKTDALDHSCAHDLVGPQDIGWDLAGAAIEFDLDPAQARDLERRVLGEPDPDRSDLFRGLYSAFQTGLWAMAEAGAAGPDRDRAGQQSRRYAEVLRRWAQDDRRSA
jgi:hypothetical protein